MKYNKPNNIEYNATQTHSVSCYSNLEGYGCNPNLESMITSPTFVTAVPALGNLMRPYKMPDLDIKNYNCGGYKNMYNFCNNFSTLNNNKNYSSPAFSFQPGFNDVCGYK